MGSLSVNKIIDSLPFGPVIFLGTFFALMPIFPEPHLWQKAMMIKDGAPLAGIDWFDICLHGGSGLLVIVKLFRARQVRAEGASTTDSGVNGPTNTDAED